MNASFENPCPGQATGLSAYYFTQMIQMLIATHCTLGDPSDYPKDFGISKSDDFDFIIVGGGSSGSVLASRLSEIKKWKVLLIESGGDPTFESDIPGFGLSLPGRILDWKLTTNRSGDSCLGMEGEICCISQGRVLGGTSTINKMHYLRGSAEDFDGWEKMGNEGWGFRDVLPYFKKSEKLDENFKIIKDADYDDHFKELKTSSENDHKLYENTKSASGLYHSKAGLLSVNYYAYDFLVSRLKKLLFDAAEELDIPHVGDLNRKTQNGYTRVMGTIHEGNRGNTAKAFLTPVKNRSNLFVIKNATVHKVIFNGRTATGVRLLKGDKVQTITAKKEVIISSGAVNSPRLLLLSGVGPKKQLEQVGIKVVQDLPGVGENLQSHLGFFGLPVVLKSESKSISHLQKIDAMYHFISRGLGFFGNVGLTDIVGFISTKNETAPDIQILHYLNHARDYYTFNELLVSLKIKNEIRDQISKAYAENSVLLICPTLLTPKSRGRIEITRAHFKTPPIIHSNFLQHKDDVNTLIKGIEFGIELTKTKAFSELNAEILNLEIEGCRDYVFRSNDYWECQIRHLATSMHDIAGTCKMGPKGDGFAVVDGSLKVYGVDGLRVVDSSIMPTIARGSGSVVSVMIAEKAADMIKKEWLKHKHQEL